MRKTVITIVTFLFLLGALPLLPGMARFAALKPRYLTQMAILPLPYASAPAAPAPIKPIHVQSISRIATHPAVPTESPSVPNLYDPHDALAHFYSSLDQNPRHTVILHYGDSPVTADSITADARAGFQSRFGDAGHGFVLIAKPWAWYSHRGIELRSGGWKIEPATQNRAHDGVHGLGGVSFTGERGAWSEISIPSGHTHVEVTYWQQPNGGEFKLTAGATLLGNVKTAGDQKQPGFASFDLPAATSTVRCEVASGSVRLFGWSFEKDQPGIVYSSLGLNGAQVQAMLRYFEPNQWAAQIRAQHPDLIILNYGTNESVFPEYIEKQYPKELRQVMQRIHNAAPEASLLVMSPMDRGERDASGSITTPAILPAIIAIQKQAALDLGWAFFDTYDAMGGAGTMAKWYQAQPRLVSADFMHPLPAGAAKVGKLLDDALFQAYDQYTSSRKLARLR